MNCHLLQISFSCPATPHMCPATAIRAGEVSVITIVIDK